MCVRFCNGATWVYPLCEQKRAVDERWESLGLLLHKKPQEKTTLALLNSLGKHQWFDAPAKGPSQAFADMRGLQAQMFTGILFVCMGRQKRWSW